MKFTTATSIVCASFFLFAALPSRSALIAHYEFESGDSTTPDSSAVGAAALGPAASLVTNCSFLGVGSLHTDPTMASDTAPQGQDGAYSTNNYTWASDTRTVAFWVKADPTQPDANATMISLGSGTGNGNRFDIRLSNGALRLELQGAGVTTSALLNDNMWHHVAVVVPGATATLADALLYVDGTPVENTSTSTLAVNTGTGPLRVGDSYWDAGRDFNGYLDDVRLYDEALDATAVQALYNDGLANDSVARCLQVSPASVIIGQYVTFNWDYLGTADSAVLKDSQGGVTDLGPYSVNGIGSIILYPAASTTYTLEVAKGGIIHTRTVAVEVRTAPDILAFHATPQVIRNSGSVRLHWSTLSADTLTISDGTSTIYTAPDPFTRDNGFYDVAVSADTTFALTAAITGGDTTNAATSVEVRTGGEPLAYEEIILADRPRAYYRFEEAAGSTAVFDETSNHFDSVSFTGDVLTGQPGPVNKAVRFSNSETIETAFTMNPRDPDNDGSAANGMDLDGKEGWSVEALVRPDVADDNRTQNLIANQDGGGTGRSLFYINNSGRLASFLGGVSEPGTNVLLDASWVDALMTVTWDAVASSYTVRFYQNGQLDATITNVTVETAYGDWVIGSHKARQAGTFFGGLMDEVAFYDYPLDDPNQDGDRSDSLVPAHFGAFLTNSTLGLLAFGPAAQYIGQNEDAVLQWTVGATASSAVIRDEADTVVATLSPATMGTTTVTPAATTTYTLDVDGVTQAATVNVLPLFTISGYTLNTNSVLIAATNLVPGRSYDLFTSPDLQSWTAVNVVVTLAGTNITATFTDTNALPGIDATRFYRVGLLTP